MTMTTKPYRLGLVVGKFSPLHKGHEHVISTAIAHCEQVLVLGYSQPEFQGCEHERRSTWVRRRFPSVINVQLNDIEIARLALLRGIAPRATPRNHEPDGDQQRYLAWLLRDLLVLSPDAIFGSEQYIEPCARTLSDYLNRPVRPVEVDTDRMLYPISASIIRTDVHAQRTWLAPEVYKDFVPRIVFLGGESTGKTTLARAMAEKFDSVWVPEYGRERWEQRGGQLTQEDLVAIGHEQVRREDAFHLKATRYLFCDTSPLTTLGYAGWMFSAAPPDLVELARRPYDLILLCEPDLDFVQDGTRRDNAFRLRQHAWYEKHLTASGRSWARVSGNLADRVQRVIRHLQSLPFGGA